MQDNLRQDYINLASNSEYVPSLIRPILGLINQEGRYINDHYNVYFIPGFIHLIGNHYGDIVDHHHICDWDDVKCCWSSRVKADKYPIFTPYYRFINLNRLEMMRYIDQSMDYETIYHIPPGNIYRMMRYLMDYTYRSGLMDRLGDSRYTNHKYMVMEPSAMELLDIVSLVT